MDALAHEYLQSVNQVLNAVSDGAFKRKCLMVK